MINKDNCLSVTQVNQMVHQDVTHDYRLQNIAVIGEVSNYRYRPNTHQYFSLKDDHTKLGAVFFKWQFQKNHYIPKEGEKVVVLGRINTYEPQGEYQIIVSRMVPFGKGNLYEQVQRIKRTLQQKGYFVNHRPMPKCPQRIAVVTSPHGAVIKDIIVTVRKRLPSVQIDLFPAPVQGDKASKAITHQINFINQLQAEKKYHFDALIIGRGGGSIEDLWPFEQENVARAIFNSAIPVISSVGHETDTTVVDYAADLRVATPTSAADSAVPLTLTEILQGLAKAKQILISLIANKLQDLQDQVNNIANSYVLKNPLRIYEPYIEEIDGLSHRLISSMKDVISYHRNLVQQQKMSLIYHSPMAIVQSNAQKVSLLRQQLYVAMNNIYQQKATQLQQLVITLDNTSPLHIMAKGYSYVTTSSGKIVKHVTDVRKNQKLKLRLCDGYIDAKVASKHKQSSKRKDK